MLSYLANRSQYVQYLNYDSEVLVVSCGVPQDYVLGPTLFILICVMFKKYLNL